jgi:hypothetical protein
MVPSTIRWRLVLPTLAIFVGVVAVAGSAKTSPSISCWSGSNARNAEPSLTVTFRSEPRASALVEMIGASESRIGRGTVQAEAKVAQATATCSGRDVILTVDDLERDTLVVNFGGFRRVRVKTPERESALPARDSAAVDGRHRCTVDAARRGGVRCSTVDR